MSVLDWISTSVKQFRKRGLREGVQASFRELQSGYYRRTLPDEFGENVYQKDWDVLLLLDACRTDALREVASDYEFLGTVDTHESPGTQSLEWMENTFTDEFSDEISDTAYVTGNNFSHRLSDDVQFDVLDEVWKYAWDDELGIIPPRPITDRAIDVWRNNDSERMIVHYMQPHIPYRSLDMESGYTMVDEEIGELEHTGRTEWEALRSGELPLEVAWDAYIDNLHWVLDDVKVLLNNLDAETVVISSDHGDAFGEKGFWGHPPNTPISVLKTVPWAETTGVDTGDYTPSVEPEPTDVSDDNVNERLRDLGYME